MQPTPSSNFPLLRSIFSLRIRRLIINLVFSFLLLHILSSSDATNISPSLLGTSLKLWTKSPSVRSTPVTRFEDFQDVMIPFGLRGKNCTNQPTLCEPRYVCRNGTCSSCISDEECPDMHVCNEEGICSIRSLWPPTVYDILANFICFFGGCLAASAGIGGGGIYVPILIFIVGFSPQLAVPMSTIMIFSSSISNVIYLGFKKHPNSNGPVIDYNAALIFLPIMLVGSITGVFLNVVCPSWIILGILVILLIYMTVRTFMKGAQELIKERKMAKDKQKKGGLRKSDSERSFDYENMEEDAENTGEPDVKDHERGTETQGVELEENLKDTEVEINQDSELPSPIKEDLSTDIPSMTPEEVTETPLSPPEAMEEIAESMRKKELEKIIKSERKRFPILRIVPIILTWMIVIIYSVLLGGKGSKSVIGIEKCSLEYWIVLVLIYPILIGSSILFGLILKYQYRRKIKYGYEFENGEIRWTTKNTVLLPAIFFGAGIIAGMLGLGGGIVAGPLLLEMGSIGEVATATSSFMIVSEIYTYKTFSFPSNFTFVPLNQFDQKFVTSSATSIQFFMIGAIRWDFALWYGGSMFFSAIVGQLAVKYLTKRFNTKSLIIFLVAFTILVSGMMMAGVGTYHTILSIVEGRYMGFNDFCD